MLSSASRRCGIAAGLGRDRGDIHKELDIVALGIADPQLRLKAAPPRIPRTVLERSRLSMARPELADKAVILLQTAAGSGKTTLIAQWRKEALQSGALAAWLTLDARDSDSRFVLGLVMAMRAGSGRPNFGQACVRAVESDQGYLEGITEWLAEVAGVATETLLILDDLHALPEATLNSSLVYLLLNAPANLKIVLASRKPVALPIQELPARGHYAALTAGDLLFDAAETATLLKARFAAKISADSCMRLHELTEGWPLGLQLAISTIERSPYLDREIATFSLHASDINRYFVESLVDHLPPAMAHFLVSVSFVDALSAALCEAITGQEKCGETLARLCELTPIFTQGLGNDWLRIHPLAREFLLARFAQLPETDKQEYHARAGRWLAEQGLLEEAARQMLRAGQLDTAFELVERCLHDVLIRGQVSLVADWLDRLPRAEIMRRTHLRLTIGWVLAQSDRHVEAAEIVGSLVDDTSAVPLDRCESAAICATAAIFADDIDSVDRIISPWYETLPTMSVMHHVIGLNQRAILNLYAGAPEQARSIYKQVPGELAAAGRYPVGWHDWIVGISHLWQGQVGLAVEKLRYALAQAESDSGRRSPIAVTLASALAGALWECNQTEEADALLANRLDVLERRTPPDAIMMGYVTMARVAVFNNAEQRALDLLDYLYAMGETRHLPRLCIAGLGEQMRMHALRGRGDICALVASKLDALAAKLQDHHWGLLATSVELQLGLAHTYELVAREAWKPALARLAALLPLAERMQRGRDVVQLCLLSALAKRRSGEGGEQEFDRARSMAGLWGLTRIYADTHPALVDWARQAQVGGEGAPLALDRAADAHKSGKAARPPEATRIRVSRSSLLSPKEREVLQLLAGNMSNKQIALAMGVSDETVKWHLKNLFGKLNAGTRKHLLDRARMMGILETGA